MRCSLLLAALLVIGMAAAGCDKNVQPCDQYDRFAESAATTCPSLAWDCEAQYPLLAPEDQQDLDWCLDCIRAQAEGETDRDCSSAPLSALDCGALLDQTLDASCFQ